MVLPPLTLMCTSPLSAFHTGNKTDSGKSDYFLCRGVVDWVSVETVEHGGKKVSPSVYTMRGGRPGIARTCFVPCGSCEECKKKNALDWTIRLRSEAKLWPYNYFVTLTYADSCLPLSNEGEPVLSKKDVQNFLKRLRKSFGSVRFFACGEYGENTKRPHYHLIIFSPRPLTLSRMGSNVFHSKEIGKAWKFGLHEVSLAEPGCMAYVAGYCVKKLRDRSSHIVPPFTLMSRKPGLGFGALYTQTDLHSLKIYLDGDALSMPRFYKNRLPWYETQRPRLLELAEKREKTVDAVEKLSGEDRLNYFRYLSKKEVEDKKKGLRSL